jgi:uncharacterized protein YecE (DUF72 family)
LPPMWQKNLDRLDEFLGTVQGPVSARRTHMLGLRRVHHAFEFRNPTWLNDDTYRVLRRYNAAFCIYELEGFTTPMELTADWTYIRLHGPGGKYQGSYSTKQLADWAERILSWNKLKHVFVYFDNDQAGYAALNALELKRLMARQAQKAA